MAGYSKTHDADRQEPTVCRRCIVGRCHLTRQTLFIWVQQDMIMVPGFPAWVCDLCGWRRFEREPKLWLRTLLHPPARPGLGLVPLMPSDDHAGGRHFSEYGSRGEG